MRSSWRSATKAHRERRFYGASADKAMVKERVYDAKVLDKFVTRVARGIKSWRWPSGRELQSAQQIPEARVRMQIEPIPEHAQPHQRGLAILVGAFQPLQG